MCGKKFIPGKRFTSYHIIPCLDCKVPGSTLTINPMERNIVGRRKCLLLVCFPFPTMFSTLPNTIFIVLSLNIFILHRLRNKFLQLILISLDSASWELHQYSRRMCGPMKNPKVETRSRDSNLGPHDCKADALPHDHGHHSFIHVLTLSQTSPGFYVSAVEIC